jgi:lipid-A-disaccharide synthase
MDKDAAPRILLSAGEPSGDLHGARVVRALLQRFPAATIDAVGGPLMAQAGASLLCSIERLSAMGLVEVVGHLPAHVSLYQLLKRKLAAGSYDLVIPIDYPGFNLWVSRAAKGAGVPVLYYIAPQLWAWRPGRARRFAAVVDRMAVILPFEERFFDQVGVRATFVGHPLLDGDPRPNRREARAALGVPDAERVLALFPGSREGEIVQHWPIFRDAALRLLERGQCNRVVLGAMEEGVYPDPGPVEIIRGRPVHVLAAADAAVAKSGTTTLQAAVADTPMVVAYRTNAVNAFLFRRLITVKWTSLVNLIADSEVVPELLQEALTEDRLVDELSPLLTKEHPARLEQLEGLRLVRDRLGLPGAAERLVDLAEELVPAWR